MLSHKACAQDDLWIMFLLGEYTQMISLLCNAFAVQSVLLIDDLTCCSSMSAVTHCINKSESRYVTICEKHAKFKK